MMIKATLIASAAAMSLLAGLSPAGAAPNLAGKFAFRIEGDLEKASCAKLTKAIASRLAKAPYKCESTRVESGKTALICSNPDGRGYVIFDTKAACEAQREEEAVAE